MVAGVASACAACFGVLGIGLGEWKRADDLVRRVKVAAYQAPVDSCYSHDAIVNIREQVRQCEARGIEFLCCPEAALGGLADYVDDPHEIAIDINAGELDLVLSPLASDLVTTIIGFTEVDALGLLYNTAAVYHRGSIVGLYRKHHPAIHSSRYAAGTETPVFTIGACTFGILICRDSLDDAPRQHADGRGRRASTVHPDEQRDAAEPGRRGTRPRGARTRRAPGY